MSFVIIWLHCLHQESDWGAKAATRGAKVESQNINSPVWTPLGRQIFDILGDAFFFNVVPRRCFCQVFSVYLYIFWGLFHPFRVPCDLGPQLVVDCTGVAQTPVLTSIHPRNYKKMAEKFHDLELHFEWILSPIRVHLIMQMWF